MTKHINITKIHIHYNILHPYIKTQHNIMIYKTISLLNIFTAIFFLKYYPWLPSKSSLSPNIKYIVNINIKTSQSPFSGSCWATSLTILTF